MTHEISFFDFVDFEDDCEATQKYESMGDTISLYDSISPHKFYESFSDLIRWQDRMEYTGTFDGIMTDTLTFTDEIWHKRGAISEFIQFFDSFEGNSHVVQDVLTLVDVFVGAAGRGFPDTLTFVDLISYNTELELDFSDALVLTDRFSGFTFNPYGIQTTVPPPEPENTVVFTSTFQPGLSVTLPAPKFGDVRTTNFKRINKKSRGQTSIISGEDNWFPTFLRKLEWDYLKEDDILKLKAFMRDHQGIPVTVLSHYAETWKVIFLRPDVEFSQVGRENRTVTLDMQIVQ